MPESKQETFAPGVELTIEGIITYAGMATRKDGTQVVTARGSSILNVWVAVGAKSLKCSQWVDAKDEVKIPEAGTAFSGTCSLVPVKDGFGYNIQIESFRSSTLSLG